MDLEQFIQRGSDVQSGRGLHERKASKQQRSGEIAEEIVSIAREKGLAETAEYFNISETAASKYLARTVKKDATLPASLLIDESRVSEVEQFIRYGNTTSIKNMILAAQGKYSEAEIRIVKADIERRGAEDCVF